MENLIKKYPEFENQIKQVYGFRQSLKSFRTVSSLSNPQGEIKRSVEIQYTHFLNLIHLRLVSEMDQLVLGLENQTPESFSSARNCLETISALIFVQDEVGKKIDVGDYISARKILMKSSMGSRTEHPEFGNSKEVVDMARKVYNVLDYVDRANKLTARDLNKNGDEEGSRKNYFRSQYDLFSELTHPNYLALSMFWDVKDDRIVYNMPKSILEEQHFGLLVHALAPMFPIYVLYFKRALKVEVKLHEPS